MRLSDTIGDPRPLAVQVGRGVLNVKYLPMSYTPAQVDALQKREAESDEERIARVSHMVSELVTEWDLTHDDDSPIPVTPEAIHQNVGMHVITAVIKAVQADQQSGESEAS